MNDFKEDIDRVLSEISLPSSGDPDEVRAAFDRLVSCMKGEEGDEGVAGMENVMRTIASVFRGRIEGSADDYEGLLVGLKYFLRLLDNLESLSGECYKAAVDLAGKLEG
jgi:hypothetical protein